MAVPEKTLREDFPRKKLAAAEDFGTHDNAVTVLRDVKLIENVNVQFILG